MVTACGGGGGGGGYKINLQLISLFLSRARGGVLLFCPLILRFRLQRGNLLFKGFGVHGGFSCLLVVAVRVVFGVVGIRFTVVGIRFVVVLVVATLHNGIVDDVLECVIV